MSSPRDEDRVHPAVERMARRATAEAIREYLRPPPRLSVVEGGSEDGEEAGEGDDDGDTRSGHLRVHPER